MSKARQSGGSGWSLRIATIAGIPVRIHFTFFLLLAYIYFLSLEEQTRISAWIIPAIFFCVLLHEFGHALTARKYGVQTRDITLYPIGGVAMLQGRRPKPKEEFWIALAGPAVNVVIAVVLGTILFFTQGGLPPFSLMVTHQSFLEGVFLANVALALFNLLPAFPMDGGRVLRAALAMRMPEERATRIAGGIGQLLAIIFGFVGVFTGQLFLVLIAFFVYLGAQQEIATTVGLSLIAGKRVIDATQTRFRTIDSGQSLEMAARMLLDGSQQDFPVTVGEDIIGLLTRNEIARGLATDGPTGYVAGYMQREFRRLGPFEPIEKALELFNVGDNSPILVMDGERILGMVTGENLSEFIMLEHAKAHARGHS